LKVGGQAVMEGVMMRSPGSLAVAVRRASGEIVVREAPWRPLLAGWRFLRWPFLRGSLVLVESLSNGISALNFSARVAMADQETAEREERRKRGEAGAESEAGVGPDALGGAPESSRLALWATLALALGLAIGLFIALPHLTVWGVSLLLGRELSVEDALFHAIVGVVKMGVFVAYIGLISLMPDVRRVFQYHGAEHQSIYAFEAGEALTVGFARRHPPMHPRCGTTFLLLVIALSILVFSLVFPALIWLFGQPTGIGILDQLIFIAIKLPLLLPIAGLAYELQRLTSRHMQRAWARALAAPGMLIQRLTTRPPSDEQLEVALTSLRQTLWREARGAGPEEVARVTVYPDFAAVVVALGEPEASG
jgi:uncharacterized protein YqhQ